MRSHVRLLPVVSSALFCLGPPMLVFAERADVKKSLREVELRVALIDEDNALIVYDAEPPSDSDAKSSESGADSAGYVAYWMNYETGELFIFGRRLHDRVDVGHALRNLRRDVVAEPNGLLELDPDLARALAIADLEPEDATTWHFINDGVLEKLLGLKQASDADVDDADGGDAIVRPPFYEPQTQARGSSNPREQARGLLSTAADDDDPDGKGMDENTAEAIRRALASSGFGTVADAPDDGLLDPDLDPNFGPVSTVCNGDVMGIGPRRIVPVPPKARIAPEEIVRAVLTIVGCPPTSCSGPCCGNPCDDGRPCTNDYCVNGICSHTYATPCCGNANATCNDGEVCTLDDRCNNGPVNYCPNRLPGTCCGYWRQDCPQDSNVCTNDYCQAGLGCVRQTTTGNFCGNDGNPCTSDFCWYGQCQETAPRNGFSCTSDNNACTLDHCQGGVCTHSPTNEGNACTSDGNPCTLDVCDEGQCAHPPKCPSGYTCSPTTGDCTAPSTACGAGTCASGLSCCNAQFELCCPVGWSCCGNPPGVQCCLSAACADDGDPCTQDGCALGAPWHEPKCGESQECCTGGNCCNDPCDWCLDHGFLRGGTLSVSPNPPCTGNTITFSAADIIDDHGGRKREDCVEMLISAVTPTCNWTLTLLAGYPPPLPALSGSGCSIGVEAKAPGTYSCTFVASANRECPPPPLPLGSITATAVVLDLGLFNGGSDLDMGDETGGLGPVVSDEEEETVGGFVLVNWDDDDRDGEMNLDGSWVTLPVPDLDEPIVSNEDNLGKLEVRMNPIPTDGVVELAVQSGGSKVKLWRMPIKLEPLGGTGYAEQWNLANSGERVDFVRATDEGVWMEGLAASDVERDVRIEVRYTSANGSTTCFDAVNTTVVMINLANAVYRDNLLWLVPGAADRGHAALTWKFLGPLTRTNLLSDQKFLLIEIRGPTDNKDLTTITQAGVPAYGCFTNPGITYVQRLRVLQAAKSLVGRDFDYAPFDAIRPSNWDGRLTNITHMRCDALVEVCYEINGVDVWGMMRTPDGGIIHYNIADQGDLWNYNPDYGTWTFGADGEKDSLEEHNDFDDFGWYDTFMPTTQCGHVLLEDASTTFVPQNLCVPVGSKGGNP